MVSLLRLSIFTDSKNSPFICQIKFIIDPKVQYITLSVYYLSVYYLSVYHLFVYHLSSITYKPFNPTQCLIMIFYICLLSENSKKTSIFAA